MNFAKQSIVTAFANRNGLKKSGTEQQRKQTLEAAAAQRWVEADGGQAN